jgi:hypothetical protein
MTTQDTTYNGWTNRETWAMALWIGNEQSWSEDIDNIATEVIKPYFEAPEWLNGNSRYTWTFQDFGVYQSRMANLVLAHRIEEYMCEMFDIESELMTPENIINLLRDIGSLYRVNYDEIAGHYIEAALENQALSV